MDAVAYDRPIVTLPEPFMRARHCAAILRMMGIDETIAESVDDFVSIAARLAKDMEARQALSQKTAERKHLLYRDRTCISALEMFLEDAAQRTS
jgi:protein O-GlcNAc transferase